VTTALIATDAAIAGVLYLARAPFVQRSFAHMGYPGYFVTVLGVAQLLGACVLLAPAPLGVREWAYAGFAFTYLGGSISHLASGDGPEALEPLALLGVLTISYVTRPVGRRR
jgi:hypothetical protein